jgi:Kef-type K+ transport system membrane component KefB
MGYVFTFCERFFHSRSKRLAMSVAFVFLTVAIAKIEFPHIAGIEVKISPLSSCMMLGTIFCNICDFSEQLMDRLDRWTAPIFILFFVISGAELKLDVVADLTIVLIGLAYILSRSAGKYYGANLSARISKSEPNIVKYLGITLLPQAGVALGMAKQAEALPEIGIIIFNLTLFSVLIYELIGPFLTKVALTKAGEIDPEGKVSERTKVESPVNETDAKVEAK